jgi:hypothetical protein
MVFGKDCDGLDVALQFTDFFVDESCRCEYHLCAREHGQADDPMRPRPDNCESDPYDHPQFP